MTLLLFKAWLVKKEEKQDRPPNDKTCVWSHVKLSRALVSLGANKWMRQRYYDSCMLASIGNMFLYLTENGKIQLSGYTLDYFGSQIEGTTMVGMTSDIDCIQIKPNDVTVENKQQTCKANRNIVVIADMFSPPGYVKLKVCEKDLYEDFQLVKDIKGNCFLSNLYTNLWKRAFYATFLEQVVEKHGPALTITNRNVTNGHLPSDNVVALRCKSIPSFTQEFFSRRRRFSWPSMSTLNIMKSQGCLLVPTGHSECSQYQRNLQWRVSFSFQERHLMLNLNRTQFFCYMLLKLVKTSYISRSVNLTSYHCKTALFYTMENTEIEIWKEENLLYCFILCLNRLKRWSKKRFCPNYFLPELNLFTGKIKEQDLYKLTDILSYIIYSPMYYLKLIHIGKFGELIKLYELNSSKVRNIEFAIDIQVSAQLQRLLYRASEPLVRIKNIILQKISYNCNDINEIINRHYKWLKLLEEIDSVAGIPLGGVKWALPHVSRFLHSSLGSHLGIKACETDDVIMNSWYTVTAVYHLWTGLNSDLMSGKMKLATMLLYTGYLTSKTFNWLFKAKAVTHQLCVCSLSDNSVGKTLDEKQLKDLKQLNASQYLEKYLSTCTVFLPSERKLTLYPLQFEMFRNFGCAKYHIYEHTYDMKLSSNVSLVCCATLDSNIYYILLNMYSSTKQKQKQLVEQLIQCSSSDRYMHRETTLNILGWLASAEETNSASLLFLKRSCDSYAHLQVNRCKILMKILGEDRNAAKWHLTLLLYRAWLIRNRE